MTRHSSSKLTTYAALCAAALIAGVAFGRPGLVALGAPFAAAVVVGLVSSRAAGPRLTAAVSLERDDINEGDRIELRIELLADAGSGRCDVGVPIPDGLEIVEGHLPCSITLETGQPAEITATLEAHRWGTYLLGPVVVRMREPGAFFTWEGTVGEAVSLRVQVGRERLRRLVRARTVGSAAGEQTARTRADGIEFADIRPYAPGDRAGHINWRATARRGTLFVNDQHPERNTDVVLFLDTFAEAGIEETVRTAAGLADAYLKRHDRVGMVGFGGVLSWLEPGGGSRQRERLTEALLGTGSFMSFAWKSVDTIPARTLPARCLVLAITPLVDERVHAAIARMRARRLDVAVVEIPLAFGTEFSTTWSGDLAQDLYKMERQVMRDRFLAMGVAIAPLDPERGVDQTILQIEGYRRYARVRTQR